MERSDIIEEDVPIGNCGDPLKFPTPAQGNSWETLLEPLIKKDKQQCDAWKEEVENVLIFAGLFSAVVTAFLVQTYKGLQADPNDMVIALLAQIAANLDGSRNSTTSTATLVPAPNSFTPSPGISRVNTLWFISLVLSLTDFLVGTVSLQWLRAHQRYPLHIEPRQKFAVFNMRRESLAVWYVPQVFSALPMLLQASLVLFFVGLVDFLLTIAPLNVFIPIAVFTALPVLFLSLTTLIPSFQWILPPATYMKIWRSIPTECPYKSPQSFAFNTAFSPVLRYVYGALDFVWHRTLNRYSGYWLWIVYHVKPLLESSGDGSQLTLHYRALCQEEEYRRRLDSDAPKLSTDEYAPYDWETFEVSKSYPIHDWVAGLYYADVQNNSQLISQEACYHAIQELVRVTDDNHRFRSHVAWCHYIQSTIQRLKLPSSTLHLAYYHVLDAKDIPENVADDELAMAAIETFRLKSRHPQVAVRLYELHIRVMKSYIPILFRKGLHEINSRISAGYGPMNVYIHATYYYKNLIVPTCISDQFTELVELLLTSAGDVCVVPSETVYGEDTLPHFWFLTQFIYTASCLQDRGRILQTLQHINALAQQHLETELPPDTSNKYPIGLFFCMALYCGRLCLRFPDEESQAFYPLPILKDDLGMAVVGILSVLQRFKNSFSSSTLQASKHTRSWHVYAYSVFVKECDRLAIKPPQSSPIPQDETGGESSPVRLNGPCGRRSGSNLGSYDAAIDLSPHVQSVASGIELDVSDMAPTTYIIENSQ